MGHRMLPIKFYPDRTPLPWQRHLGPNRLQLDLYKKISSRSLSTGC